MVQQSPPKIRFKNSLHNVQKEKKKETEVQYSVTGI